MKGKRYTTEDKIRILREADRGHKTRAGHASTDHCTGGQCHAATKRIFSIPFTRTAHR